ncbi:MAG: choice-of-anchor J domain-containing protein, partial [Bacteroidota bacterium]|nr:choice-of-anchor J domain-containing protein [Bacteroidota bacterium]
MQPNSTLRSLRSYCIKIFATALIFVSFNLTSKSQVLFNEDFVTMVPLPAGWAQQNLSTPVGTNPPWFQGNTAVFAAQNGAATSYAACNFNSVAGAATISNWLFTPNVTLTNGDIFTFYTRAATGGGVFPDRLQIRMSTNGASVNVGATNTSVGDYTTLLVDINPTYSTTAYPEVWTLYTVTISGLAGPVSGRLAFRYFVENGGPAGANSNFIGVDNVSYITFATPCTGTPVVGNITGPNPVCPNINFTLTLPLPTTSGLSYQWQSSPDNVTYTNIAGANGNSLTTSLAATTWYRVRVTCGVNTGTSAPLQVVRDVITNCYCAAGATSLGFEKISNVTYGTINNSSTSTAGYQNFSGLSTTMVHGQAAPITVSISGGFSSDQVAVWIDYNQDGDLIDPGELVLLTGTGAGPLTGIITIPITATVGPTRMRVRMFDSDFDGPAPCGNTAFGQVEDYTVNIQPCIQGVYTTQPSSASIQCSGNASFSIATTGSALSYQWQQRISAAAPWTTVTNGGLFSGATTTTLTLSDVPGTISGYQYRAVMVGPCTAVDFSNPVTLTVNPLVATVSPASATICAGSIQQLTLTNASSPSTVTFTNNTPLPIPDGAPAGVFSTIPVSGIPAGAIVSNVSIKINIPDHTYVGDLEITVRAPNGALMNLIGELDGGTGSNSSDGFVNTVISSTSVTPLSGAPAPRTGTFAADRLQGYGPSGAFQTAPNGMPWSAITTILNGNWVLGLSDWYGGDVGTLTNWSVTITYGAPASGVWTSTAPATMFTNATATIPYVAGSLATTIFVQPTTGTSTSTTNYSVVYSTATPCTSAPTVIPVTTVAAVSGVVNPANTAACVGNNATFTVSALGGNPLTYQWQVSTDAGVNWTNIAGATSASYTATGVTLAMNGNRYRAVLAAA